MKLRNLVLKFLTENEGLFTVNDIAYGIGRKANTNLRTAIALLVEGGHLSKQPVYSDAYRLAFGYCLSANCPKLF